MREFGPKYRETHPLTPTTHHTARLSELPFPCPGAGDMYGVATDTGPTAGSLIRRQSLQRPAAACDASLTGDGDADGLPHGLPIHFSYGGPDRGSAKGGARKKERVYRYCSFTLLLALLVCTSAVYLLLKAHHRQGRQLAHHHAGWTATYEELQAKHSELRDHREALTRKGASKWALRSLSPHCCLTVVLTPRHMFAIQMRSSSPSTRSWQAHQSS
jgi:hypothetical protein